MKPDYLTEREWAVYGEFIAAVSADCGASIRFSESGDFEVVQLDLVEALVDEVERGYDPVASPGVRSLAAALDRIPDVDAAQLHVLVDGMFTSLLWRDGGPSAVTALPERLQQIWHESGFPAFVEE